MANKTNIHIWSYHYVCRRVDDDDDDDDDKEVGSNNLTILSSLHTIPVMGQYFPTVRICNTKHL